MPTRPWRPRWRCDPKDAGDSLLANNDVYQCVREHLEAKPVVTLGTQKLVPELLVLHQQAQQGAGYGPLGVCDIGGTGTGTGTVGVQYQDGGTDRPAVKHLLQGVRGAEGMVPQQKPGLGAAQEEGVAPGGQPGAPPALQQLRDVILELAGGLVVQNRVSQPLLLPVGRARPRGHPPRQLCFYYANTPPSVLRDNNRNELDRIVEVRYGMYRYADSLV
eukprot:scaffold171698_cov25-Prasinocladus_malaysianus.AAC.2